MYGKASQSNAARVKAFAGWFCPSSALRRTERQCKALHCKAQQSKAVRAQAFTGGFSYQCRARQGVALQRMAKHSAARKSKAGVSLETATHPICFPLLQHYEATMSIQQASVKITGIAPLLQNNPQTVDPFNAYAKAKKAITNKRTAKTEDDLIELGNLETESKIYFDEKIGVYVPATWLTEAIIVTGFSVAKIGRQKMRGGLFAVEPKIALDYQHKAKVKTINDVVGNPVFRHRMLLKQGQVRVPKDAPIFHQWSFETTLEFDDTIVDLRTLKSIIDRAAKYGGFGDFRPTFGRATAEVSDV